MTKGGKKDVVLSLMNWFVMLPAILLGAWWFVFAVCLAHIAETTGVVFLVWVIAVATQKSPRMLRGRG